MGGYRFFGESHSAGILVPVPCREQQFILQLPDKTLNRGYFTNKSEILPFMPDLHRRVPGTIGTWIDELPNPFLTCHRTHLKSKFYLFKLPIF
ncbi:MAG TPA: hypothetical protein DDW27_15350 [Bacteroidales bacterium]|nr:hypothetical protein [Bacteroidales bacterium]